MDLEKELVSKILPYSEFRINLILESTTRIRNLIEPSIFYSSFANNPKN